MIYDKFSVVLLSALNAERPDSTNAYIAGYMLEHRAEVANLGIQALAERTHVGVGSISRFCKDIGLADFAALKALLQADAALPDSAFAGLDAVARATAWSAHVGQSIALAAESLDAGRLRQLCREIHGATRVSAYGLLKAESAAIDLQVDMLHLGRRVHTCISYAEQMRAIQAADADDLILLFSYTGAYFEYGDFRADPGRANRPRLWMICAAQAEKPRFVDEVLCFSSPRDRASHPFQLEAAESLLALTYAEMYANSR